MWGDMLPDSASARAFSGQPLRLLRAANVDEFGSDDGHVALAGFGFVVLEARAARITEGGEPPASRRRLEAGFIVRDVRYGLEAVCDGPDRNFVPDGFDHLRLPYGAEASAQLDPLDAVIGEFPRQFHRVGWLRDGDEGGSVVAVSELDPIRLRVRARLFPDDRLLSSHLRPP